MVESATDEKLRALGFGYRAPYIISSLNSIKTNGDEKWLREMRD